MTHPSHLGFEAHITLSVERCWKCGKFWAHEDSVTDTTCPACLRERCNVLSRENEHLEKSVRTYKGALTKARKRRKK